MHWGAAALVATAMLLMAPAAGATPSLSSPAADASFTEGNTITFSWDGDLEGDADAADRAYFRVEVAAAGDDGWSTLYNSIMTDAGSTTTSAKLGAPDAGSYKWHVCAWGVVDESVSMTLEEISCSSSRTMSSVAVTTSSGTSGVTTITHSTTVQGDARHETQVRDVSEPADPAPVKRVIVPSDEPVKTRIVYTGSKRKTDYGHSGDSVVSLSGDGGDAVGVSSTNDGTAAGTLASGLSATLPGVPIPFWSLALLAIAIPLTALWRRSLMNMFEWPADEGPLESMSGDDYL